MFNLRRILLLFTIILIAFLGIVFYQKLSIPNIESKAAIMLDTSTGNILYEKNATTAYPVASMSKLMTIYLVLESIERGEMSWHDEVLINETANDLGHGAVSIPVTAGDTLIVQDLFHAMVISSANNATIALAEHVAGTERAFAQLMNETAADLELSEAAYFVNATGLPDGNGKENEMSAKDVAAIAAILLEAYPSEILEITNQPSYYIPIYDINIFTTNKMLLENEAVYLKELDGLKTGYTVSAGYGFVGTAANKDKRLITVIMNAENEEKRFIETKKLLNYGFDKFSIIN